MTDELHSHSRKALVSLLLEYRERLFGFVFTLVHNRSDAEDIFQEASMVMWEKFDRFQAGSDFVAWANQIIYFCVQNFRRRQARAHALLDDSLLQGIADAAAGMEDELELRQAALRRCLGQLRSRDREMVLARYSPQGSVAAAAEVAGRTLGATYTSLKRVRRALLNCITSKLATEGA